MTRPLAALGNHDLGGEPFRLLSPEVAYVRIGGLKTVACNFSDDTRWDTCEGSAG